MATAPVPPWPLVIAIVRPVRGRLADLRHCKLAAPAKGIVPASTKLRPLGLRPADPHGTVAKSAQSCSKSPKPRPMPPSTQTSSPISKSSHALAPTTTPAPSLPSVPLVQCPYSKQVGPTRSIVIGLTLAPFIATSNSPGAGLGTGTRFMETHRKGFSHGTPAACTALISVGSARAEARATTPTDATSAAATSRARGDRESGARSESMKNSISRHRQGR